MRPRARTTIAVVAAAVIAQGFVPSAAVAAVGTCPVGFTLYQYPADSEDARFDVDADGYICLRPLPNKPDGLYKDVHAAMPDIN